ncbi:hypothetical protein KDI_39360 [Dictyobacter arantiisoli]|uniref:Uncharacterized protein n=1 Tax=Dictyobacter arantiisoli TaxID=2014874 RepID=A0A5A5TGA2_9CHLR|nr:hypothetical protein KDI_39360 [Dictyobacter arantiisoli]
MNDIHTRRNLLKALPTLPLIGLGLAASQQQQQPLQDVSLITQLLQYHREAYFSGGDFGNLSEIEETIGKFTEGWTDFVLKGGNLI